MENQNPSHNSEMFNDEEKFGFLQELCTTKRVPPDTLRSRILTDVNNVLIHSLKERYDSFLHYLLIAGFAGILFFFTAVNYSPLQQRHMLHYQGQTSLPRAFSLPRSNIDFEKL